MKPGEIEYDFSELDQDEEFQEFLRWRPAPGKIEEIDIEKCEEGVRKFVEKFIRPSLKKSNNWLFIA